MKANIGKNITIKDNSNLKTSRGDPLPLGAFTTDSGINFSLYSKHASSLTLVLFLDTGALPSHEISLDPVKNKTGDIWHIHVEGLSAGIEYGYRLDKQPNPDSKVYRYNKNLIMIDPYTRALNGGHRWDLPQNSKQDSMKINRLRSVVVKDTFDWGMDQPLYTPMAESIIYELHVRGFTQHPSAKVKHPGTFKGLIEKIPYLKELGITAVELLPICEFNEAHNGRKNPVTGEILVNYWGYNSICFCAPKASYASEGINGKQIFEFKTLVKALHESGIEIILDVVFNHTGEEDEQGPVYSFRGIDNPIYYMIDKKTRAYLNFSGCGNTVNCNHPVVMDLIIDCLRYWVIEMHVDGFRFDLASILTRGEDGSLLAQPPLVEHITKDPILAHTKLIAEPWDAAGLYQVGSFPAGKKWAEWNDKYRDDIRRYIRGDQGMVPNLATRLAGSSDLYRRNGRFPYHSINFVTCHDGFTLADLVSYKKKHNRINGESNRDGMNENFSRNYGKEGPTDDLRINRIRKRQMKNMALLLILSQGVPMLLAGDEMGRSQNGNNNAYCQDNEISWINWNLLERNAELFRFFKLAIQFRKQHTTLRRTTFFEDDPSGGILIKWYDKKLKQPNWAAAPGCLGFHLLPDNRDEMHIFVISNSTRRIQNFKLPTLENGKTWRLTADTNLETPNDICDIGKEQVLNNQLSYEANPLSTIVLIA